jgi:hypothetical protein
VVEGGRDRNKATNSIGVAILVVKGTSKILNKLLNGLIPPLTWVLDPIYSYIRVTALG